MRDDTDLARYHRAMINGSNSVCVAIEQKHGLYGYPPELVSVGLRAIIDGKNAEDAVEAYIAGKQQ